MKRSFALLVLCVMVGMLTMGCASLLTRHQVNLSPVNGDSVRVGQAENKVWLGFIGERNYPSIDQAASAGGITKVATVEHYMRPGILMLWRDYYTIVTGQ